MDLEVTQSRELNINDTEQLLIEHENASGAPNSLEVKDSMHNSFFISLFQFIYICLKVSVLCGILFGLFTTLLWWIELNVRGVCRNVWNSIPRGIHHARLLLDSVEVIITTVWPLLSIAPICSWSMVKQSNMLFWSTIAGLLDVTDRLLLYVFGHYGGPWKSYVGNVIFLVISFVVYYKLAKFRQVQSYDNQNPIILTFKLLLPIIVGSLITFPYNYVFLTFYQHSLPWVRTILSCSLIAVFYVLRLIINNMIANMRGIFDPSEGIVFVSMFLIISTMVARLAQAAVQLESLYYFVIISLVHGVANVVDKAALPLRHKIINLICRKSSYVADEIWSYTQQYIAHQSLISIITETSSVIMSNAAAYLMVYYYKREETTGKRYSGFYLFKEMVVKSSIAVFIEWFFNIIAMKLQYRQKIPVFTVWKKKWKLIFVIHLIQVIFVVVYFAMYIDTMLANDLLRNSTIICVGRFRRL